MVAYLEENGHKFRVNPEKAWEKEREIWTHNRKAAKERGERRKGF
jgi:hypothetical protein